MESSASASVVLSQTKATKAAAAAAVTRLNKDLETEEDQENAK